MYCIIVVFSAYLWAPITPIEVFWDICFSPPPFSGTLLWKRQKPRASRSRGMTLGVLMDVALVAAVTKEMKTAPSSPANLMD